MTPSNSNNGMPENFLRCKNPQCNRKLHPVGNFSYGSSSLAQAIRKYTLISISILAITSFFGAFLPSDWGGDFFHSIPLFLIYLYVIPVLIIFAATKLLPKTTVVTCHHCGHQKEYTEKIITAAPLPKAIDTTPPALKPNEVVDISKIDPSDPNNDLTKRRRGRRSFQRAESAVHTPFMRKRRK